MSKVSPVTQSFTSYRNVQPRSTNVYYQNIEKAKQHKSFVTKKRVLLSIGFAASVAGMMLYFRKEQPSGYLAEARKIFGHRHSKLSKYSI